MIDTLIEDSELYTFIKTNYKLPISVECKDIDGEINANLTYSLPLKKIKSDFINNQLNESGIYMFKHITGKFAIGSAMNFRRRLVDHINSFRGHRQMQKLHKFTNENGGLNNIVWSPLVICPNFYNLFISKYPNHVFTDMELQVLTAATQFMPRVLEQCYLTHYKPKLNGGKNLSYKVIFHITKTSISSVQQQTVIKDKNKLVKPTKAIKADISNKNLITSNIYKAIDKDKNIIASSSTMNGLASKLGITLPGLKYHLGRESYVYSKVFGLLVNICKEGLISTGYPKDYYRSKKIIRDNLELKNRSLSSLEKGYI